MSDRRCDRLIAGVLFVVVTVVVGVTAGDVGFTRDEGYYFKAGELYARWWRLLASDPLRALSSSGINEHLGYNPEHPFLMKGAFGLSRALQTALGIDVFGSTAMRFPSWIVAGIGASALYALGRALLPRAGALAAVALLFTMPQVFWHAHLACFDTPVVVAHVVLVLAWVRYRRTPWGAVVVGVAFGIAGAVKHNVLPVPALLVAHWLFTTWVAPTSTSTSTTPRSLRLPLVFVSLAVVGPVVYVLLWPWLWPDVVGRFGAYLGFHVRHEHYPILYFGELLTAPPFPWTFPVVMSALTIPLPVLVISATGVVAAAVVVMHAVVQRSRRRPIDEITMVPLGDVSTSSSAATAMLLLLNIALPVVLIALPSSPIFGGTKHWMNALPFVCLLAAWAMCEGVARLTTTRRTALIVVVTILIVAPGLLRTAQSWPYGLSSYNELAGGIRGAANLGLQRTFWGYEVRSSLPVINERTPRNARLHFGDVNADAHRRYVDDGLLRKDIAFSNTVRGAGVAHVEPQGEFKQQQLDVYNEWRRAPDVVVDVDGVPLSTITFR